jgi:hypothetical protein
MMSMETRKIDDRTEARLKEINDYYYKFVVVTYEKGFGESDQRYYTSDQRDAAYADFNSR